jgi:hypothetical protein
MDINSFIYPEHFLPKQVQLQPQPPQQLAAGFDIVKAKEKVDLKYIIENKPPTQIVREFMEFNLLSIVSEEESLFKKEK